MKKICINCNKEFEASRADAKYCSTNCKNQYNYQLKANALVLQKEKEEKEVLYLRTKEEIAERDKAIIISSLTPVLEALKERLEMADNELNTLNRNHKNAKESIEKKQLMEVQLKNQEERLEALLFWNNASAELVYNCYIGKYSEYLRKCSYPKIDSYYVRLSAKQLQSPRLREVIRSKQNEFRRISKITQQQIVKTKSQLAQCVLGSLFNLHIINTYEIDKKKINDRIFRLEMEIEKVVSIPALSELQEKVKADNIVKLLPVTKTNKLTLKTEMTANDILKLECESFQMKGELGRFLGKLERQACAITLIGDSGAGKSYFSYDLAYLFDQADYAVYYFSLEEGIGELTKKKLANKTFSDKFMISGKGKLPDVRKVAKDYDVIIIDSFGKLDAKAEDYDKLRMDFPNTIFISIFQKTTTGSVRGGSAIVFDSSAIINIQKRDDVRVAIMQKSRYGTANWEYSLSEGEIIKEV